MSGGVVPDGVGPSGAGPGGAVPTLAESSPVANVAVPPRRVNAGVLLKTRPVASTTCFGLHLRATDGPDEPILLMSVPRRVLKRAVDRNTVRRLARESLRATREQAYGCALMLRLKRTPTGFEALTQRARKAAWRAELERVFSLGVGRA